jgi:hypothetical protein
VIATALSTIKMPELDFNALSDALIKKFPDVSLMNNVIVGQQACSNYINGVNYLTFKIADQYFKIPPSFFTESYANG